MNYLTVPILEDILFYLNNDSLKVSKSINKEINSLLDERFYKRKIDTDPNKVKDENTGFTLFNEKRYIFDDTDKRLFYPYYFISIEGFNSYEYLYRIITNVNKLVDIGLSIFNLIKEGQSNKPIIIDGRLNHNRKCDCFTIKRVREYDKTTDKYYDLITKTALFTETVEYKSNDIFIDLCLQQWPFVKYKQHKLYRPDYACSKISDKWFVGCLLECYKETLTLYLNDMIRIENLEDF